MAAINGNAGTALERSESICAHMNTDHSVTVHQMCLESLPKEQRKGTTISNYKLKSVSRSACTLSFVVCNGDLCDMKTTTLPFVPPLQDESEVKSRLIQIHQQVMTPKVHWLVTDPLALLILVVCTGLGYATLVLGIDNLTSLIEESPSINNICTSIYGSAATFVVWVKWAWWFTVVAHGAEAWYVVYQSKTTLKLKTKPTLQWAFLISCVGYPVFTRFTKLVKMQKAAKANKKQK